MGTTGASTLDDAAAVFAAVRPRLFGIAYRMLGSAVDAEDLLQEVWVRWQTCDRSVVENPAAYLATTTTRLAINATQTAYARRESYVGPWLPEPVDTSADPALGAERAAALELAVLLLLEKLTPTERAAYVLREAFDYPYSQIAEIVQTTEVTARQYVSRARKHLAAERRAPVDPTEQRRLLAAFVAAAQAGDLSALEDLLAADVVNYADGGGVARAAKVVVTGVTTVAKLVAAWGSGTFWDGIEVATTVVNGVYAMTMRRGGELIGVVTVAGSAGRIDEVMWMVNPGKLTAV
ncbi:sigma-70 family RNA polymerase sigma factor [Kutzneria buriramensis]|uniref:RNA polymerase sigma-70 factor (ECF subfamily) n=1 Tax=Kutzneria buriramensis TaxID=1045776 RepID=A0A3E0HFN2_9PSEU|nr:sigma-70 family RNA polymerase sigma factor [Kutzneria buriramensis]REH44529.1 RNA polymerase sigma-70 factor (ECF subfamily) [Kutzneria buriramensis]